MGPNLDTSGDFYRYIGVYVAIVTVCSTAFFVFVLPRVYDHFNNLNYRNYKEMLDLRKSLVDNNRIVDYRIEKMIAHYEGEFIINRDDKLLSQNEGGVYKAAWKMLWFIFLVVITILGISMGIYQYLVLGWLSLLKLPSETLGPIVFFFLNII